MNVLNQIKLHLQNNIQCCTCNICCVVTSLFSYIYVLLNFVCADAERERSRDRRRPSRRSDKESEEKERKDSIERQKRKKSPSQDEKMKKKKRRRPWQRMRTVQASR